MGRQIRVLHVFGSLDMGGAETMIMNIYRKIDRSMIQFDFVVHGDKRGMYEKEIKKMGGKIYRMPRYKLFNHFSYKKAWNDFLKTHEKYQIIHGHMRSTASIYLNIAKKFNLITICHSHSTSNGKGISAIIKKLFQKNIVKYADYLFGCSEIANEWLYGKGINKQENCYVIKNGIDVDKFKFNKVVRDKIRNKYHLDGKIVIGHVGRFINAKNHTFLLDVFNELLTKNSNYYLLLIGDGELKEEIIAKIKTLDIENNVLILPSQDDVYNYYQAMDIFVFPSLYEGLGMVAVEAQMSGLSVIVSDRIPEEAFVSNGIIKVLLDNNTKEWANIISNLNLERNKKIDFDSYSIQKIEKQISSFYKEVINSEK